MYSKKKGTIPPGLIIPTYVPSISKRSRGPGSLVAHPRPKDEDGCPYQLTPRVRASSGGCRTGFGYPSPKPFIKPICPQSHDFKGNHLNSPFWRLNPCFFLPCLNTWNGHCQGRRASATPRRSHRCLWQGQKTVVVVGRPDQNGVWLVTRHVHWTKTIQKK